MQAHLYCYKVKVFNQKKKKDYVVREIYHFHGKFASMMHMKKILSEELVEDISVIGYFEGKQHTKRWLVSEDDLQRMYLKFNGREEIFLWCNAKDDSENTAPAKPKNHSDSVATSTRRQAKEDELDSIFKELKEKHEDKYSIPQLRLWARMISCGTHDDVDEPPHVPLIVGAPQPKRQKQESLTSALVGAATAFANAISPKPNPGSPSTPTTRGQSTSRMGLQLSPGRAADVCMKNLEQLRFMQKLVDDGILSQEEFLEQKHCIMEALRKI